MKKAASAPALPTCSGVNSGQARQHTAAANAAANSSRPRSGVGGERSSQLSSMPSAIWLRPIQDTSTASSASRPSQRQPKPCARAALGQDHGEQRVERHDDGERGVDRLAGIRVLHGERAEQRRGDDEAAAAVEPPGEAGGDDRAPRTGRGCAGRPATPAAPARARPRARPGPTIPAGSDAGRNAFIYSPSRSGRNPTSHSLPRCARLPMCSASCFASRVSTALFFLLMPETTSALPSVSGNRRKRQLVRQRQQLHADAAVGPLGKFLQREQQQAGIGGQRGDVVQRRGKHKRASAPARPRPPS